MAASDVWDLDHYLLTLLPAMLRRLADEGMSYPGIAPFETPEKWETWLREMADKLESLQEDWAETRNEYDEPYFHALEEHRRVRRADPSIIRYDTYNDKDLEDTGYRSWWLFKCSCGNLVCRHLNSVNNTNKHSSCGCYYKKIYADKNIGKTYNYLTIIALD